MIVSMSRVETLLDLSALEAELIPEQKKLHAEDVEIFVDVLLDEATEAGILAFEAKMADLPEEDFPWSAVRARHYWKPDATFGDAEQLIRRGPPALSLALARRPELEPELAGDEIPEPGTPGWDGFWQALGEWQVGNLRAAMGPVGWIPMENDPKTALDPTEPPVDPVILPEELESGVDEPAVEPPVSPTPTAPSPATPSSSEPAVSEAASTPSTGDAPATNPSIAKAALQGAGVVAGLAVLGGLAWYAMRPEETPAP